MYVVQLTDLLQVKIRIREKYVVQITPAFKVWDHHNNSDDHDVDDNHDGSDKHDNLKYVNQITTAFKVW